MYITTMRNVILNLRETGQLTVLEAAGVVPLAWRHWLAWMEMWDYYAKQTKSRKNGATEKVIDYFSAYYAEWGGVKSIIAPFDRQENSSQQESPCIPNTSGKAPKPDFGKWVVTAVVVALLLTIEILWFLALEGENIILRLSGVPLVLFGWAMLTMPWNRQPPPGPED